MYCICIAATFSLESFYFRLLIISQYLSEVSYNNVNSIGANNKFYFKRKEVLTAINIANTCKIPLTERSDGLFIHTVLG